MNVSVEPWQWDEQTWRGHVQRVRAGRSLAPKSWRGGARVAVGRLDRDRIEVQPFGELVDRRLERERAGGLAGAAIERGRAEVEANETLARGDVRHVVEHPCLQRRAFHPILEG